MGQPGTAWLIQELTGNEGEKSDRRERAKEG